MMHLSRCPRCESRETVPCDEILEASDEIVRANFECSKCHARFRFTPPTRSANPKENASC